MLSSLLCNFYYGSMERAQFPHLLPDCEVSDGVATHDAGGAAAGDVADLKVLMRLIDDFLLLSTRKQDCVDFVQVLTTLRFSMSRHAPHQPCVLVWCGCGVGAQAMDGGFPQYGCSINNAKTQVNFSVKVANGQRLPRFDKKAPGQESVPRRNSYCRCCEDDTLLAWCGVLINPSTMVIHADLQRYVPAYNRLPAQPVHHSLRVPGQLHEAV